MKIKTYIIFSVLFFFGPLVNGQQETETVISSGFGIDLDSALKNSAENALMNVVGTLVEADRLIENRIEITNGIENRVKNVNSRNSRYSQGSIREIELLNSEQDDSGLFRVQARITVEMSDFKAYLTESVLAKKSVNVGLFSRAQVSQQQNSGLTEIVNRILDDLFSLEVYTPEIYGEINLVDEPILLQQLKKFDSSAIWVSVPIAITINDDFFGNLLSTLDETAQDKYQGQPKTLEKEHTYTGWNYEGPFIYLTDFLTKMEYDQLDYGSSQSLQGLLTSNSETFISYRMPELFRSEVCKLLRSKYKNDYDSEFGFYPTFEFSVLDSSNNVVKEGYVSSAPSAPYLAFPENETPGIATILSSKDNSFYLFKILGHNNSYESCALAIDKLQRFELFVPMRNDELSRANSFEIKISNAYE